MEVQILLHLELKKILRKKFLVDNLYLNERDNFGKFKILAAKIISKFFIKERYYLNSLNIFSRLNIEKSNSDLINIHWIGNELVSLNDLIKTKKKFYGLCMIYGLSLRLNIF